MIIFDTWCVYINSTLLVIYFLKESLLRYIIFVRLKCFIGNWGSWEATLFTYSKSIFQLPFPMTFLTGEIKLYSGKSRILFHFKCSTACKVINYFFLYMCLNVVFTNSSRSLISEYQNSFSEYLLNVYFY